MCARARAREEEFLFDPLSHRKTLDSSGDVGYDASRDGASDNSFRDGARDARGATTPRFSYAIARVTAGISRVLYLGREKDAVPGRAIERERRAQRRVSANDFADRDPRTRARARGRLFISRVSKVRAQRASLLRYKLPT